jgi:hypothetical protein
VPTPELLAADADGAEEAGVELAVDAHGALRPECRPHRRRRPCSARSRAQFRRGCAGSAGLQGLCRYCSAGIMKQGLDYFQVEPGAVHAWCSHLQSGTRSAHPELTVSFPMAA